MKFINRLCYNARMLSLYKQVKQNSLKGDRKMKKTLAIILVVLTLASLFVFPASAKVYTGDCGRYSGITWEYDEETGEIRFEGSGSIPSYEVIDGRYSTAPWKSYMGGIKSVFIWESISVVGANAFYGCGALKEAHILDPDVFIVEEGNSRLQRAYDEHHIEYREGWPSKCSPEGLFDGRYPGWYCLDCDKYVCNGEVDKAEHTDYIPHDGVCNVCGHTYCDCDCHKELTGIKKFFWNFKMFFWQLFKTNLVCECGARHRKK